MDDCLRWATANENRAISETFNHLGELSNLWTEAQKDFAGG